MAIKILNVYVQWVRLFPHGKLGGGWAWGGWGGMGWVGRNGVGGAEWGIGMSPSGSPANMAVVYTLLSSSVESELSCHYT